MHQSGTHKFLQHVQWEDNEKTMPLKMAYNYSHKLSSHNDSTLPDVCALKSEAQVPG